jgi:hypothetical protein
MSILFVFSVGFNNFPFFISAHNVDNLEGQKLEEFLQN